MGNTGRLPAYDLLTHEEAYRHLCELMGPFAPAASTFAIWAKPSYARRHPGSAEALHLAPTVRRVGGAHRSGWTREQLAAYAEARAAQGKR